MWVQWWSIVNKVKILPLPWQSIEEHTLRYKYTRTDLLCKTRKPNSLCVFHQNNKKHTSEGSIIITKKLNSGVPL